MTLASDPGEHAAGCPECNQQHLPWVAYSVLWTQPHATESPLVTTTMLSHLALQNESKWKWGDSKQFLEIHIFRKLRHSAFLGLSCEQQLFPFQSKHVH